MASEARCGRRPVASEWQKMQAKKSSMRKKVMESQRGQVLLVLESEYASAPSITTMNRAMMPHGRIDAELEGEDDGDEIDAEGENPEQRDGGDVGGEIAGDGAELHGGAHGEEDPEELVGERGGRGGGVVDGERVRRSGGGAGFGGQDDGEQSEDGKSAAPGEALGVKGEVGFDDGGVKSEGQERGEI